VSIWLSDSNFRVGLGPAKPHAGSYRLRSHGRRLAHFLFGGPKEDDSLHLILALALFRAPAANLPGKAPFL
jgi:hypothetical protein